MNFDNNDWWNHAGQQVVRQNSVFLTIGDVSPLPASVNQWDKMK